MRKSDTARWSKWVGGALALFAGLALSGLSSQPASAQSKQLTLCWAAWDPANALVELGKDFTEESGIEMKYEFVPWTSYADRFLNELNSHGKLCDLIIGDSQWIGGAAENHWYVKLNDFFAKEHITMDDFVPATVVGYSEWPKNTPNYWALPAMADAVGWTYRKDWFARPEIQAEFKKKYGRDLAPPKTWDELKQIAEFFQGREIDGKKVYGAYIYTERGSEGITMGVTNVAVRLRLPVRRSQEALSDGRLRQLARRGQRPRVLQGALQVLHRSGHDQRLHAGRPRRLQVGPGGDADELVRLLPRPLQGSQCRRRQDRLLRQSSRPERPLHPARRPGHLGGRQLRPSGRRAEVHQVVRPAEVQQKWWEIGGYSALKAVVDAPGFPKSAPFAPQFLESMAIVKDFWAEPSLCDASARHAEAGP